jgi:L,D-transpeptidase YcbB
MLKKYLPILALLLFNHLAFAGLHSLQESIRNYIESKPEKIRYIIDNELLYSSQVLPRFYLERSFEPAWFGNDGLNHHAYDMLQAIYNADEHGLNPTDYHLGLIERYEGIMKQQTSVDVLDQMKLEILLTDAFMLLASHLYFGKVESGQMRAEWKIQRKEPELRLDIRLQDALAKDDIRNVFNYLSPTTSSYAVLKTRLAFFKEILEVEWETIIFKQSIKPGEQSTQLPAFRKRLKLLKFEVSDTISELYDAEFEKVVKRFQLNNGLNPDGVIGRMTTEAMNITPAKRIETIRVNMERIRWLPVNFPERYILVNIANAELDLIDGSDTIISMRAIVGRHYRGTPIFSARMTYLVFSPTWTVPPGIFRNDIYPELKKGPEYLAQKNMRILRLDGTEIDYTSINWDKVSATNFPYMIRQQPGADNALGKVKFMFPNQYNIYIHDTPTRGLFAREDRALSSGCIRIEKPFELARILLEENPQWTPERITTAMNSKREQTVTLPTPITVVMVYFTAWTDGADKIQFRRDVYNRDAAVLNALLQKPDDYVIR